MDQGDRSDLRRTAEASWNELEDEMPRKPRRKNQTHKLQYLAWLSQAAGGLAQILSALIEQGS